jgi:hypothetical protein
MGQIKVPTSVLVWTFGGKPGNVSSQNVYTDNSGYNMVCRMNKKNLTWNKRPMGINLDWTTDMNVKKIHFRVQDKKEREIRTGEHVAFGLGMGDAFLYYAERDIGINLKWASEPHYEWMIIGADGTVGQPVKTGQPYAVINEKVKPDPDFLVYLDRPMPGVADIGWTSSPDFWDKIVDSTERLAMQAAKKGVAGLIAGALV